MQGKCFFKFFFREGFVNFVVVNSGNLKERQLLQFSAVFFEWDPDLQINCST